MKQSQNPSFTGRPAIRAEGGSSSRTSRQRDSGATSSRRISTATSSRTIATISTQYTSRLSMGVTSSPLPVASSSLNIVPASTAGRRLSSRSGPSSSSGTITTVSSQLSIVACGKAVRRMQAARLQALPGRAAIPRNSFHWPGGSSSVIISCEALTSQPEMHGLLRLTEIPSSLRTFPPGFYVASTGMEQWLSPGRVRQASTGFQGSQFWLRSQDIEHPVPPEYLVSHRHSNRISDAPALASIGTETLLWTFYNFCCEEAQLVASRELYDRGWRYHRPMKRWIKPVPETQAYHEGESEYGYYYCWNPLECTNEVKRMRIDHDDLDSTPPTYRLPSSTINVRVHCASSSHLQQWQQQQRQLQQQQQHQRQRRR